MRNRNTTTWPLVMIAIAVVIGLAFPFVTYAVGRSSGSAEGTKLASDYELEMKEAQALAQQLTDELAFYKARTVEASETITELQALLEDEESMVETLKLEIARLKAPKVAPKPRPRPTKTSSSATSPARTSTKGVEQWRPLVRKYFGANTDAALRVMKGESGGNPRATNGSCRGLFQIHDCHRADFNARCKAKRLPADPYHAESNIMFAAYMSNYGRNWGSWSVQP